MLRPLLVPQRLFGRPESAKQPRNRAAEQPCGPEALGSEGAELRDERPPFRPVMGANLARSGRVYSAELGFRTLSVDLVDFRSPWPVPVTHRVGPEGKCPSRIYTYGAAKGLREVRLVAVD